MRVYVCGQMRGYPKYNFPLFDKVAKICKKQGFDPVSPADLDRQAGTKDEDLPENGADCDNIVASAGTQLEIIKRDLEALLDCDAICLLPNWDRSTGAIAELSVAEWAGLTIYFYDETNEKIKVLTHGI
jgi:nucleoside 2-deoxyribosyltransferase